jgi:hypothetical protein
LYSPGRQAGRHSLEHFYRTQHRFSCIPAFTTGQTGHAEILNV